MSQMEPPGAYAGLQSAPDQWRDITIIIAKSVHNFFIVLLRSCSLFFLQL